MSHAQQHRSVNVGQLRWLLKALDNKWTVWPSETTGNLIIDDADGRSIGFIHMGEARIEMYDLDDDVDNDE